MQNIFDRMLSTERRFHLTRYTYIVPAWTEDMIALIMWQHVKVWQEGGISESWNYKVIGGVENFEAFISDERILRHIEQYRNEEFIAYIRDWIMHYDMDQHPAKFDFNTFILN